MAIEYRVVRDNLKKNYRIMYGEDQFVSYLDFNFMTRIPRTWASEAGARGWIADQKQTYDHRFEVVGEPDDEFEQS